jgi:hypothetical protein
MIFPKCAVSGNRIQRYFFVVFFIGSMLFAGCNQRDQNLSNVDTAAELQLPKYSNLCVVQLYTGHGKCGDVLIPSITRVVTAQDRETLLRNIMKKEGWVIISAFSTKEAFDQRTCDSFPDRAPAFKTGYIGKIDEDGKFYD